MKKIIDALWDDKPDNFDKEVNEIFSIANVLRGDFQRDEYRDVILPFTIIRRFECAFADMKDKVVAYRKKHPKAPDQQIFDTFDITYFNTSPFTLKTLLDDADNIAENFYDDNKAKPNPDAYVQGFSTNVREILDDLNIGETFKKLKKARALYTIIQRFSQQDLNPVTYNQVKMGYIFEELIRRYSENKSGGENYTARDITKLMASLLLSSEDNDDIFEAGRSIPILDQACGTGGMLSTAFNYIRHHNADANIYLFGQEVNPESYAICKAEMLIKGQNADNVICANTMIKDCFPDQQFRFILENPPFGEPWGGKDAKEGCEAAVKAEAEKGPAGRWAAGLPAKGDMQLLFIQSAVRRLAENGRAAIIEDGSPLFAGSSAGSGESQIRKWLLDQDLLEAIIALPEDMFYNTNIGTYIWILTKHKSAKRRGKVQLINATSFCKPRKKSLGKKRNDITPEHRAEITRIYDAFEENEYSKIFDNDDFKYREYTVIPPMQRNYSLSEERVASLESGKAFSKFYDINKMARFEEVGLVMLETKERKQYNAFKKFEETYNEILKRLKDNVDGEKHLTPVPFLEKLSRILDGIKLPKGLLESIAHALSVPDRTAEMQHDKKGNLIYDEELKDTEIVPYTEDIETYMTREVWPHIPKAKYSFDENLKAKKPIIKTGAEYPFTRYFYKYVPPRDPDEVLPEILALDKEIDAEFEEIAKEAK